jgi:hypothetical protein
LQLFLENNLLSGAFHHPPPNNPPRGCLKQSGDICISPVTDICVCGRKQVVRGSWKGNVKAKEVC